MFKVETESGCFSTSTFMSGAHVTGAQERMQMFGRYPSHEREKEAGRLDPHPYGLKQDPAG